MDTFTLYASPTNQHRTAVVAPAAVLDSTDRLPTWHGNVVATASSAQENFEDGIVALLPLLQRVAFRMTRGPQDAEDLVQETVTRALTYRHQFRPDSNLRAWLITIMRSLAVSTYRRTRRAPQMQSMDESEMEAVLYRLSGVQGSPSAEHMMLHTWLDQDLVAALAGLPEHFRRAVELCDVEGLSYQQTARTLGCALGTVMSRLHRGRALLRTALTGSDIGLRPAAPVRTPAPRFMDVPAVWAAVPEERAA
jgi:RNA polymerase sigma-70 factor (ECF subfamily)